MRNVKNRLLMPVLLILALPAAADAQQYVYVTQCCGSEGEAAVLKVETTSNRIVGTLAVDAVPTALAVTPDGGHVYVASPLEDLVLAVNTETFTLDASVPVGVEPLGLAITPDGKYVYVLDRSDIEVIQTDVNVVVTVLPTTYTPQAISISPDGRLAYVTDGGPTVHVLQIATNTFLAPLTVSGAALYSLAASPAGGSLYAIDSSLRVLFLNAATGAVTRTVTVPLAATAIAIAPDGSTVYVTDTEDATSSIGSLFSISLGGTVRHVRVGFLPNGVALSYPDGRLAYVSNPNGAVSVIDTATSRSLASLATNPTEDVATKPSPLLPLFHYEPELFFQITHDEAVLSGTFGLGPGNTGLGLPQSDLTLEIADIELTIPANSFQKDQAGGFTFAGVVNSAKVQASIDPVKGGYQFSVQLNNLPLKGIVNPVTVRMIIGNNIGGATINAKISQ